jgi:SpoVK/Ycf46/Vps4 family AAA+-type ATPase
MSKKLKPGYRALFYGPPGTGKTITAALLGKYFNREVYKIDLSLMVSKYIGETEKNLAKLFDRANNKDWILFFDEADALFGKRSQVKDAHDRYANQEISYLLQRVEVYNGLVILASNLKENIDDAFMRRFQSKIYFPFPTVEEKLKIWKLGIPKGFALPNDAQLTSICQKYKLTGAAIMNIIQYCSILSLERGEQKISLDDINSGIKKEFTMESN